MPLKKVLVIEDNLKHLNEVKNFIDERVRAGADIKTRFVSTLEEAREAMDTEQYDGIISDIFFPEREGTPPDPVTPLPEKEDFDDYDEYVEEQKKWAEGVGGVKLVREAQARRIPFILCTSTFHHGEKTQPVSTWLRKNNADFIVDASDVVDGESEHKDWRSAFIRLAYIRSLIDHKLSEIDESGKVRSNLGLELSEAKEDEVMPLVETVARDHPYGSGGIVNEVAYGITKGKLHTMDPILMEVLDGPGKGLVPYTSEEPTSNELLERINERPNFREDSTFRGGLGVRTYNDEEKRKCTESEIEERTAQGVEQFIARWKENRPRVEQAWREWSKLSKEGIEGAETELPKIKLK